MRGKSDKSTTREQRLKAHLELLLGGGISGGTLSKYHRLSDYLWTGPRNKEVVLAGNGLRRYNYAERAAVMDKLKEGIPLNARDRRILLKANDSFSQPSFAVADALNAAGVKVRFVDTQPGLTARQADRIRDKFGKPFLDRLINRRFDRQAATMSKAVSDKSVGALLQVAPTVYPEEFAAAHKNGKYTSRLLTDYGDGAWRQPFWHTPPEDIPYKGFVNGMAIQPSVPYDTVYVPGGGLKKWDKIPKSQHVVNTGGLANSPIFGTYTFKGSEPAASKAGSKAKAILFTGGGSGLGLPFETDRLYGNLGLERHGKSLLGSDENILDYILQALRKKHGDNFQLDFMTGMRPDPGIRNLTAADINYLRTAVIDPAKTPRKFWHSTVANLQTLKELLDKDSPLRKRIFESKDGADFIRSLDKRYKGLNLVGRVDLPGMAEAYRSADYLLGLPGSSVGEIASIKGNTHGGLIHLIPREVAEYPRHFRGNAEATNRLMQPKAKHNIVSIGSKTLKEDLVKAIEEGGTKNWGRLKNWRVGQEGMKPLVKDLLKHVKWSPRTTLTHAGRGATVLGGLGLLGHGVYSRLFGGSKSSDKKGKK